MSGGVWESEGGGVGETPLMRAAASGNVSAADALLRAGERVDVGNSRLSTPLHLACEHGHLGVAALLLAYLSLPSLPPLPQSSYLPPSPDRTAGRGKSVSMRGRRGEGGEQAFLRSAASFSVAPPSPASSTTPHALRASRLHVASVLHSVAPNSDGKTPMDFLSPEDCSRIVLSAAQILSHSLAPQATSLQHVRARASRALSDPGAAPAGHRIPTPSFPPPPHHSDHPHISPKETIPSKPSFLFPKSPRLSDKKESRVSFTTSPKSSHHSPTSSHHSPTSSPTSPTTKDEGEDARGEGGGGGGGGGGETEGGGGGEKAVKATHILTTSSSSPSPAISPRSSAPLRSPVAAAVEAAQRANRAMDADIPKVPFVFLGGACNPTTWRRCVAIPYLSRQEVAYFNPQVDEWRPELVEVEARAKRVAAQRLFVVNGETRGVASMVEVAELAAGGRGREGLVVVLQDLEDDVSVDGERLSASEIRDLNRGRAYLADVLRKNDIPLFSSLDDALRCVASRIKREHGTKLPPSEQ